MTLTTRVLLILCLVTVSACAGSARQLPMLPSEPELAYRLGAGDTLQITVFGEPDLTGSYPVSAGGSVDMPLIGSVAADGLTVAQLQQQLVQKLDAKAVKSPNVTVAVTSYRPFFILGEVKNPGSYPYVPNMTVLTAVAIAGGFTYRASQDTVSVTRVLNGRAAEARAPRDARVLPGDVINIFERHL